MQYSNWFVVCMGIGSVFVVLICIIILCKLMSLFCKLGEKEAPAAAAAVSAASAPQPIENRQQVLAAVCAVIAEELGAEVKNLKVHSFRKL